MGETNRKHMERDDDSVEMDKMLMILTYEILLLSFKFKQSLEIFKEGNLLLVLSASIEQVIKLYVNNTISKTSEKIQQLMKKAAASGGPNSRFKD